MFVVLIFLPFPFISSVSVVFFFVITILLGFSSFFKKGPLLYHSYGLVLHLPVWIISDALFPIMHGLSCYTIHSFCYTFVSHIVLYKISSLIDWFINSFIHLCCFSLLNVIYIVGIVYLEFTVKLSLFYAFINT